MAYLDLNHINNNRQLELNFSGFTAKQTNRT